MKKTKKVARPTYKGKFVKEEYRVVHRDKRGRFCKPEKAVKTQTIKVYRIKGRYVRKSEIKFKTVKVRARIMVKQVAVYGKNKKGETKRYHFFGTGKELQQAVSVGVKYPPKRKRLKIRAASFLVFPEAFIDLYDEWVDYEIES